MRLILRTFSKFNRASDSNRYTSAMTKYIRITLGLLTILAFAQGCSSSPETGGSNGAAGSTCDAVCSVMNDQNSSIQTNYWRIAGLGCGGTSGCYALVSLYEDGVGEITWSGNASALCPVGVGLIPVTFAFTKSSANGIAISGNGLPIQCSSNVAATETVFSISDIVTVARGVFDADFSFGSATINYHGDRVNGTF